MNRTQSRIYVACLASYNNGHLHGEWINANQDTDALFEEVKNILALSPEPPSEEFAIHDYEGFGDLLINEYTSLQNIASYAEFISEHGELGAAVLAHRTVILKKRSNY